MLLRGLRRFILLFLSSMICSAFPLDMPMLALAVYPRVSLLKSTVDGIPALLTLTAKTPKYFDETRLVLIS